MKADWKPANTILPKERIRVLICDSFGFMQTAFYGYHSTGEDDKVCWRSDNILAERPLNEKEVVWWDYFPDCPKEVLTFRF